MREVFAIPESISTESLLTSTYCSSSKNPVAYELFDDADARFIFLGNNGTRLFFQTNFDAPNGRVIAVDLLEPERLVEVIPEKNLPMLAGSNVGGDILDIALDNLAMGARVVLCGGISRYNETGRIAGPENYFNLVLVMLMVKKDILMHILLLI